jgi:hypothetical protein
MADCESLKQPAQREDEGQEREDFLRIHRDASPFESWDSRNLTGPLTIRASSRRATLSKSRLHSQNSKSPLNMKTGITA